MELYLFLQILQRFPVECAANLSALYPRLELNLIAKSGRFFLDEDAALSGLPHEFSRMPSVCSLVAHYSVLRELPASNQGVLSVNQEYTATASTRCTRGTIGSALEAAEILDLTNSFYVVDPDDNLPSTSYLFSQLFPQLHYWTGFHCFYYVV